MGDIGMRFESIKTRALLVVALPLFFGASLAAQSAPADPNRTVLKQTGPTWTETFEGSADADGIVTDLNSTFGYVFTRHFSMDTGLPVYFIHAPSSIPGATSSTGIGNPYVGLRYATKGAHFGYASTLNGAMPLADTKKGLSTGRTTFDWDNHFDHEYDHFTPFLDLGVGNSISDTRFFHRPFITLGNLAHFEGGTELDFGHNISFSASAYYILPWGQQKVFSRFIKRGSSGSPKVRHGRVFEMNAETVGGPGLTRDEGMNLGFDFNPNRFVDFNLGYSYSAPYALNTFSFGISFNIASILRTRNGK
jgi:hypothetical protein